MKDEKEYICSKVASCPFELCVYHRAYSAAQAERWGSEDDRSCYPMEGISLDPLVVVAKEQPA